jgi:hypothetical protein
MLNFGPAFLYRYAVTSTRFCQNKAQIYQAAISEAIGDSRPLRTDKRPEQSAQEEGPILSQTRHAPIVI